MKIPVGVDWRGTRVVIWLDDSKEVSRGKLLHGRIKNNKFDLAEISIGVKGLTRENIDIVFATIFHELAHLTINQEILEKYGVLVLDASVRAYRYSQFAKVKEEMEANKLAVRYLRETPFLNPKTLLFLSLAQASYLTQGKSKERIISMIKFLSQGHQLKR